MTSTIKQLAIIAGQYGDIVKRISDGTLDAVDVKYKLMNIVESEYSALDWTPPDWWRTYEQQIACVRKFLPGISLPRLPRKFTPQTEHEVPMLHVPGLYNKVWGETNPLMNFDKYDWENNRNSFKTPVRLAPNKVKFTEPVWLGFGPERGRGGRPDSFWNRDDIAADEVFSALIQFPEWPLTWGLCGSGPNLTGYQVEYRNMGEWSGVLGLEWWGDHQGGLFLEWGDKAERGRTNPSVRVLD